MEQNCKGCNVFFDSEGHKLGEWLTFCHECNRKLSPKQMDEVSELRLQESQDAQELNEAFGVTE